MEELTEAQRIYVDELNRRMKYYERIVYAIVKVSPKFSEPEKTIVERILGGGGVAEGGSEISSGGEAQSTLKI